MAGLVPAIHVFLAERLWRRCDPAMRPVEAGGSPCHIRATPIAEVLIMAGSTDPLVAFSDHAADLVERVSKSVVGVHGGARRSISGILWRPGVVVTAEESLEGDDNIAVTLPGGRRVAATLAGR